MERFIVRAGPDNQDLPALQAMKHENHWVLETRAGNAEIVGRLLGYGSSRRSEHTHKNALGVLGRGHEPTRCPACRWYEVRVFCATQILDVPPLEAEPVLGDYVIHTLGPSLIDGEVTYSRVEFAQTGFEVIELCTVRRGDRGEPYLPAPAARALSQAAGVDRVIQDAYVNRAVA